MAQRLHVSADLLSIDPAKEDRLSHCSRLSLALGYRLVLVLQTFFLAVPRHAMALGEKAPVFVGLLEDTEVVSSFTRRTMDFQGSWRPARSRHSGCRNSHRACP